MRVIVVGAGEVGSSIAASLADSHEVVVIDIDRDRVEALTYSLDVLAIEGDGADLDTLREAGIEQTDMVIASTDDDETNIVTCGTVKTTSDAFTIARVKNTKYLTTWQSKEGAFGVDFLVCTDLLTAESIVRVVGLPATQDVDAFAGGSVLMAQFGISSESPITGQTIRDADRFDSLTFAAILRGDEVVIPRGETTIETDDQVIVIGSPESVRGFAMELAPGQGGNGQDVVIIGGSEIAFQTARLLEARGFHPRLIEDREARALDLAEKLPNTTVMQSDPTDIEFLTREMVGEADIVIAGLESDERNLLASLLAKRLGAKRTVAIVDAGEYVDLFEAVGVDVAVNPREATAEEITRFTRDEQAENVALIESDRAEVLEFEIKAESVLAGRPIQESVADLPEGVVIGAVTRDNRMITPRGDTVIEVNDHVVLFVDHDAIDAVTASV
ncbi:Trk system potassium transporter TrkA [Haladaptatus sp. DJG-WS-42]|uniref:Trk system potassium transporter TrkA n=1 Tax=Haladaptatus sp. DJG-WS-42 TaxID=3120516 RepID=UPI0030CC0F52